MALCEGSPVDSPRKDQWRGGLMFSLIWAWTDGWAKKESGRRWFESPSRPLWRHSNDRVPFVSSMPNLWFAFTYWGLLYTAVNWVTISSGNGLSHNEHQALPADTRRDNNNVVITSKQRHSEVTQTAKKYQHHSGILCIWHLSFCIISYKVAGSYKFKSNDIVHNAEFFFSRHPIMKYWTSKCLNINDRPIICQNRWHSMTSYSPTTYWRVPSRNPIKHCIKIDVYSWFKLDFRFDFHRYSASGCILGTVSIWRCYIYQYRHPHVKDKTVSRPSYL